VISVALLAVACESSEEPGDSAPTPTVTTVTTTVAPVVQPGSPTRLVPTVAAIVSPTATGTPVLPVTPANTAKIEPSATPTTVVPKTVTTVPTAAPTTAPTTTPTSAPSGSSTGLNPTATAVVKFIPALAEPEIPTPPDRDLQDLGKRLIDGYTEPTTALVPEPLIVGQQVDFWVSRDNGNVLVSGEVSYISEHVYWVFENGFIPDADDVQRVAEQFESEVWPAVIDVFGTPLKPGVDGDGDGDGDERMVVYTTVLRTGVAGYFSAADSYSSEIRPNSNQRVALYMSANRVRFTGDGYLSVIAHELQHATHFATDSSENSWVNEGLSEMAAEIAGFVRSATSAFVRVPSTSLTAWAQDISLSSANYGAANLFFAFIATHYGGYEMLTAIAQDQLDGLASIDSALATQGFNVTANDVYADWLIANYLSTNEGPYGYANEVVPPVKNIYKRAPDSLSGSVRSFGADYVVTSSGSGRMTIEFTGEAETSLLNSAPYSGDTCWWSNQGDSIDSTLTRTVDLSSVETATLKYWVDYKIEEYWDYGYLMVSTDDGATWDILDTNRAINFNPNGNAYGAGITGSSLGWVQDSVDLSEYAGEIILLRFEYITDDAVYSKGACLDDFEIPELDWFDDTSGPGDWIANGFAQVDETVPTQYLVQVIHEKKVGDPVVYQIPVGIDAEGSLTVEGVGDDDLIVAVISAVTRHSTIATEYTLRIAP
jgi:immune inhibitor A